MKILYVHFLPYNKVCQEKLLSRENQSRGNYFLFKLS